MPHAPCPMPGPCVCLLPQVYRASLAISPEVSKSQWTGFADLMVKDTDGKWKSTDIKFEFLMQVLGTCPPASLLVELLESQSTPGTETLVKFAVRGQNMKTASVYSDGDGKVPAPHFVRPPMPPPQPPASPHRLARCGRTSRPANSTRELREAEVPLCATTHPGSR